MCRNGRLERGEERPQAPDAAEIVCLGHLLDRLRLRAQEAAPARNAGVVDEQAYLRMALADRRGHLLDSIAVGHVADLPLSAERLGERTQALLAA